MADIFATTGTTILETDSPFRILALPAELISSVCAFLEDDDLVNIRCVCRVLKAHSTTAFGTRFFCHLIAILHPTSLAVLLELSRHEILSKYVRKVTISGELLGHSIFPLQTDMPSHLSLQKSIENSGLDYLILLEAFKALQNLEVVGIDVGSFHAAEEFGFCDHGVRCGRVQLYKENVGIDHNEAMGNSRVYDPVLRALHSANVHERVELSLMFHPSSEEDWPVSFFDVQSLLWTKSFAPRLRDLYSLGLVDSKWINTLMHSATDLRELHLQGDHDLISLPTSNKISQWPEFRKLELDELLLQHRDFVPFLREHGPTLEYLHLQGIGFPDGNWIEPLEIIESMPKLTRLFVNTLFEQSPYNNLGNTLDRFDNIWDCNALDLVSHDDITVALVALRSELRTEPMTPFTTEYAVAFHHTVDLRKAKAAEEELILCVDGNWVFNPEAVWDLMSSDEDEISDRGAGEDGDEAGDEPGDMSI